MKRVLLTIIASAFLSGSVFAAPLVEIEKGQVGFDYTYTFSKNQEVYNTIWGSEARKVDGSLNEYAISYGLGKGTALTVSLGNLRNNTYTDQNGSSTPKVDMADLYVQKRLTKGLAAFAGVKRTTGSWSYSSAQGSVTRDNNPRNEAELGIIGRLALGQGKDVYVKAGFGSYFTEYKAGITYECAKNLSLDVGYNYFKLREIGNPQFTANYPTTNNLDITAQGLAIGLRYSF